MAENMVGRFKHHVEQVTGVYLTAADLSRLKLQGYLVEELQPLTEITTPAQAESEAETRHLMEQRKHDLVLKLIDNILQAAIREAYHEAAEFYIRDTTLHTEQSARTASLNRVRALFKASVTKRLAQLKASAKASAPLARPAKRARIKAAPPPKREPLIIDESSSDDEADDIPLMPDRDKRAQTQSHYQAPDADEAAHQMLMAHFAQLNMS